MVDTPPTPPAGPDAAPEPADSAAAARAALRRRLRTARADLDPFTRRRNDRAVTKRLAPLLEALAPRRVAGYLAIGGELDPDAALRACRERGVVTLLPVLTGDTLAFSPFDERTPMRPNRFGIDEPCVPDEEPLAPRSVDVVLVPLVGFDDNLDRLGMGGGFYDRSFAARRAGAAPPWLIGVAHEAQRVDDVFPDWWDVPLDVIVTESGVRRRDRERSGRF